MQLATVPKPIVAKSPRERCQVDTTYMTKFVSRKGNNYILTVVDCFTKRLWAFPMKNRAAADVMFWLGPLLEKEKFKILQTDNGGEFNNNEMDALMEELEMLHKNSAPYDPKQNGQIERSNQTIKITLMNICDNNPEDWDDLLPEALTLYNNRKHWTTKVNFYIVFS